MSYRVTLRSQSGIRLVPSSYEFSQQATVSFLEFIYGWLIGIRFLLHTVCIFLNVQRNTSLRHVACSKIDSVLVVGVVVVVPKL